MKGCVVKTALLRLHVYVDQETRSERGEIQENCNLPWVILQAFVGCHDVIKIKKYCPSFTFNLFTQLPFAKAESCYPLNPDRSTAMSPSHIEISETDEAGLLTATYAASSSGAAFRIDVIVSLRQRKTWTNLTR